MCAYLLALQEYCELANPESCYDDAISLGMELTPIGFLINVMPGPITAYPLFLRSFTCYLFSVTCTGNQN